MAEFVTVAPAASLPPGAVARVTLAEKEISIWNVGGDIYAIDDICTHEEANLSDGELVENCCVMCPLHGAEFDLRTGAARCLPATVAVATYPARILDGNIQLAL